MPAPRTGRGDPGLGSAAGPRSQSASLSAVSPEAHPACVRSCGFLGKTQASWQVCSSEALTSCLLRSLPVGAARLPLRARRRGGGRFAGEGGHRAEWTAGGARVPGWCGAFREPVRLLLTRGRGLVLPHTCQQVGVHGVSVGLAPWAGWQRA